jgi:hypothetical protein
MVPRVSGAGGRVQVQGARQHPYLGFWEVGFTVVGGGGGFRGRSGRRQMEEGGAA